jgi:hypothetical protein
MEVFHFVHQFLHAFILGPPFFVLDEALHIVDFCENKIENEMDSALGIADFCENKIVKKMDSFG